MSAGPSDPRVDELRQRLRSLGYLDAGVDRFVLAPASGMRSPWSIALLSGVRVGMLAAVLLGPAAAIGVSARLPGLVTGPRDAIVVALYLAVFFGLGVAAAAFIAGLFVSAAARRAGPAIARRAHFVARGAGLVVTLLCLVYLTLWWRAVIADVGWSAPAWTLSALAIAAAISVLLGHAVSVMSAAVIVAHAGSPDGSRRTSWRTSVGTAAASFGVAVLLLTISTRTAGTSDRPPPMTVVPSGVRIRLLAIDGFDARVFEELAAAGRVPALTGAFKGAVARLQPESDAGGSADPARVWTTVATGQPATVHGVHGLETRRLTGVAGTVPAAPPSPLGRAIRGATDLFRLTRPAVASGSERRAKTFWEVAAEAGLRTSVVNWWATWPASDRAGSVLSDRATLRLEHGGDLDAEIAPAALYDDLRREWPSITSRARGLAANALTAPDVDAATRGLLERSAALDALQLVLSSAVTTAVTDLSIVYLPGLDIAQHALIGAPSAPAAASTVAARLDALKAYYVALDRLVAPLLVASAGEIVIVIAEPGRVPAEEDARIAVVGDVARSGATADGTKTSVAPTVLHALGVPVALDLTGRPLLDLFAPQFVARYPVRFIATYGPPSRSAAAGTGQPLDQEMIDRLRSLGYVR